MDSFGLKPEAGWRPDLDALERIATPGTKLIAITNPNNPVGTVLTTQVL
jgi:aspartate/methionine/tyrosine aminotransferase